MVPSYPAALPELGLLAVTAIGTDGSLWALANRGAAAVDLAAPGEQILLHGPAGRLRGPLGDLHGRAPRGRRAALLHAARPDLPAADLCAALLGTPRRSGTFRGLMAAGALGVGAAMRRVRPGAMWRRAAASGAAAPSRLRLRTARRVRSGRATVRWRARGFGAVVRWRCRWTAAWSPTCAAVAR